MSRFSSDLSLPPDGMDLFYRRPYAKKIANELVSQPIKESYAIGLYSQWGYGKTSAINMLVNEVGDRAIILKFNPWVYSSQQAMVRGLLTQIMSMVYSESEKQNYPDKPKKDSWIKKKYNQRTMHGALSKKESLGVLLHDYAELTGLFDNNVGRGAKVIGNLLDKDPLGKLRKTVEGKIANLGKRVIVIIDDVDRLDEAEMFEIFKSVKIIADFEGITYLVAFDDIQVSKALNTRFSGGQDKDAGRKYLEKIIQIPLHLPKIEQDVLDEILLTAVVETLAENNIEISDEDVRIFRDVYKESISKMIKTPRNVYRYLNSIKFTLPILANEINPTDLLIVESIRVFFPDYYQFLGENKLLLTGNQRDYFMEKEEWEKEAKEKIASSTDSDELFLQLLKALFPHVKNFYQTSHDRIDLEELRRRKFVASEDYFDRYFTFSIGKSDIADSDIVSIVSETDSVSISSKLSELLRDKNQRRLLAKLRTYSAGSKNPLELAKSIAVVGDKLSSENGEMFGFSPVQESTQIIGQILSKSKNQLNDYKEIVSITNNLDQLTHIIRDVLLGSEIKDSSEPILSALELEDFKNHVLSRIRDLSKTRLFQATSNTVAYHLYHYWSQFSSRDETSKYILSKVKNTSDVLDFLTNNLSTWTGGNGTHRGDLDRATLNFLGNIVDTDKLYSIVRKENPKIKDIESYPDLSHDSDDVARIGNERSSHFRDILLRQFIFLKEHEKSNDGIEPKDNVNELDV